jgi:antitoxin ParD1/3/4
MNVSLTPALEKMVQEKVASGLYNSASEVIREALRLLAENDKIKHAKLMALREDVDVGLRQLDKGQFTEYDDETSETLLQQFKSRRKK